MGLVELGEALWNAGSFATLALLAGVWGLSRGARQHRDDDERALRNLSGGTAAVGVVLLVVPGVGAALGPLGAVVPPLVLAVGVAGLAQDVRLRVRRAREAADD
jgi:hypothetical protein